MRTLRVNLCLGCILLSILVAPAAAQSTSNPILGDQQLWDFGAWGAEAVGKEVGQAFGETQISMAGFHIGRVIRRASPDSGLRRTWEYTLELQPLFLVTRVQHAYGGGFAPVGLRWNFAPRGRYRPYLEFNGGAMFSQKNVPAGNTSTFNFTAALGPGVMWAVNHTQAVSVAIRFWHLSNGYIGESNPSFNTVEFVVGYHWLTSRHEGRQRTSTAASHETD
jgi:Lipid A 3-O-deacylase (PagL)